MIKVHEMKDWFVQKLKQENKQRNCCMAENYHEQAQNDKLGKIFAIYKQNTNLPKIKWTPGNR